MSDLEERVQTGLAWLAGGLWLLSFFLPAARLGPPGDRPALGLMAAVLSGFILPLAVKSLGSSQEGALYALLTGLYFTLALLANLVMAFSLRAWFADSSRRLVRVRRWLLGAAILVWGVPWVDYESLYRTLGLARGNAFELELGYYLWAVSFAVQLLAVRFPAFKAPAPARERG